MDYDIVNVAQGLVVSIDPKNSNVMISAFTDVFPSATLDVNGERIVNYAQPSFEKTHHLTPKNNRVNGYRPTFWFKRN